MKMKNNLNILIVGLLLLCSGCSDKTEDIIIKPAVLTLDNFSTGYITGQEADKGIIWSWSLLPEGMQMDITVLRDGKPYSHELTRATSIVQKNI